MVGAIRALAWTASGICVFGGMIDAARGRIARGAALVVAGVLAGAALAAVTA